MPDAKKEKCPCKGCGHNITGNSVDFDDWDTEIGCDSKRRCAGRTLIPVKTMEVTRDGCKYRTNRHDRPAPAPGRASVLKRPLE